jgi:hypothetical protein
MNAEEIQAKAQEILAARLRRNLFWGRLDGAGGAMAGIIFQVAHQRIWKHWGYPRLLECLIHEFRIPTEQAITATEEAIARGDEDGSLYTSTAAEAKSAESK